MECLVSDPNSNMARLKQIKGGGTPYHPLNSIPEGDDPLSLGFVGLCTSIPRSSPAAASPGKASRFAPVSDPAR